MLYVEVNKMGNKFSVIIYNCIYEQKTQYRTSMSVLNMHLNRIKILKAMTFGLDCFGKAITQTKLKVLTEYAENNNEIGSY